MWTFYRALLMHETQLEVIAPGMCQGNSSYLATNKRLKTPDRQHGRCASQTSAGAITIPLVDSTHECYAAVAVVKWGQVVAVEVGVV